MSVRDTSARVFVLLLIGFGPLACGEDPTEPRPDPASLVAEIRFAVDDALGLYAGESVALGAVAYDSAGVVIADAPIHLAVTDGDVIAVDSAGTLTAVAQGAAAITATLGDVDATVGVRVTDFVEISAKTDPLCARDVEGAVWCIGTEWQNNVVIEPEGEPIYETWTLFSGDLEFSRLASGYGHGCGTTAGETYCWGSNVHYQLGTTDVHVASSEPVPVEGPSGYVALEAGWEHTCALDGDGAAYCWGRNFEGQMGNGAFGYGLPTPVVGGHTWRAVDAGDRVTCGVAADGVTYCWGWAMTSAEETTTPTPMEGVPANLELIRVDVFGCGAIDADIYCWGHDTATPSPAQITMPADVVDIVLGYWSVCALLASGDIYCWGSNERYLLGDPALTSSSTPVLVDVDGRTFSAITGEWRLHCGLADDGGVYCWGSSSERPFPLTAVPTRVPAPMP